MSIVKWNPRFRFPMLEDFLGEDIFPVMQSEFKLPAVNVREDDGAYKVEIAAPGMQKDDFKIELDNGVLTISAEKKSELEEKKDNYTRKEFGYTAFKRSFWLPELVKEDKIEAKFVDGVLKLELPKKEVTKKEKPKMIEIG